MTGPPIHRQLVCGRLERRIDETPLHYVFSSQNIAHLPITTGKVNIISNLSAIRSGCSYYNDYFDGVNTFPSLNETKVGILSITINMFIDS